MQLPKPYLEALNLDNCSRRDIFSQRLMAIVPT